MNGPSHADRRVPDSDLEPLLARLTLEEKVRVLTGRDFWTTWPLESVGLRRMLLSDGPSGVRGEVWDERSPSLNLPSASALSASWDPDVAYRYGAAAASEARRKGVDVVLGPTINLQRSPLGGRHFEMLSEDPLLTGELAAAYTRGLQDNGVAATPKHYVANDYETERFTASTEVDERTLREVYLAPFERAVVDGGAWLVMSAYNSINGTTATEHELLETPLSSEWGFDGVVVSDWTAVRSLDAASASQDLVMPGPDGPWGHALVEAVRRGEVDEAAIDRKVLRLLRLAARVGALEGFAPPPEPGPLDGPAFAREVEADGIVLVRNRGEVPWEHGGPSSIAVIGHNAALARTQGGGSATVIPASVTNPLDGIRAAFPEASVTYELGAIVQVGVAPFPLETMTNPATGAPGARVRFLDREGSEVFAEDRLASGLIYFGGDAPVAAAHAVEFHTSYTPDASGELQIGAAGVGSVSLVADGVAIGEGTCEAAGTDLGANLLDPASVSFALDVVAGVAIDLRFTFHPVGVDGALSDTLGVTFGTEPSVVDDEELIARAVRAAAEAEAAVVVVGTNSKVESEGYDRTDLALPGRQDDLVRAVAAVNPRTIVVVNSGSPVLTPWRDEVAAVLLTWFGGQEYGHALGDVLTGRREPGGRLPTTWPASTDDVPVIDVTPVDGRLSYSEGIHIGYRAWLRAGRVPAFPFGSGLGYTTWELGAPVARQAGGVDEVVVTLAVTNTGDRAGKQVVQVYAERARSAVERPHRWLVGFAVVRARPAETVQATVHVPFRALAHWDHGWAVEAGQFTLRVGTDVEHLPAEVTWTAPEGSTAV